MTARSGAATLLEGSPGRRPPGDGARPAGPAERPRPAGPAERPRPPLSVVPRRRPAADTGPLPAVGRRRRPAERPARAGLSLLWAVLLVAAVAAGSREAALVTAPVAAVATVSALRAASLARSRRAGKSVRAPAAALALGALSLVAAAAAVASTPAAVAAVALLAAAGAALAPRLGVAPGRAVVAAAGPAVAAVSVVAVSHHGVTAGAALVATVCLYDGAAHLMGGGRAGRWLGPLSGLATAVAVGFILAAVANPPLTGTTPWVLTAGAGLLAPVGVGLARRVVGPGRAPALGRLDSLMVAGPFWLAVVALFVHR